ncbi:MAG: hypothetical protein IPK16_13060 [Anaerolineales bacterium]|nr:hypothetical protein [Anaerolineales bacterium]
MYFRRRWLHSLRAKQRSFPTLYNFAELEEIPLVRDMTAWLIDRYGHVLTGRYANTDQYFAEYSVGGDALSHLTVPTTILTSRNDPVVPVIDFYALAPHPLLHLNILPTGGHCGFMDAPPVRHRLPEMMLQELG